MMFTALIFCFYRNLLLAKCHLWARAWCMELVETFVPYNPFYFVVCRVWSFFGSKNMWLKNLSWKKLNRKFNATKKIALQTKFWTKLTLLEFLRSDFNTNLLNKYVFLCDFTSSFFIHHMTSLSIEWMPSIRFPYLIDKHSRKKNVPCFQLNF